MNYYLTTKIKLTYSQDGLYGVAKKTFLKLKKSLFITSSTFWFKRDLKNGLDVNTSSLHTSKDSFHTNFNTTHETITFLKDNHNNFTWMYIEEEIDTANEYNHLFPNLRHNTEIIGYVKIAFDKAYILDYDEIINMPKDTALIYDSFIMPAYRNKGLARQLISESLLFLKDKGYKYAWCSIPDWNKASIKVYQSCGFEKIKPVRFLKILKKKLYTNDPEKLLKHCNHEEPEEARRVTTKLQPRRARRNTKSNHEAATTKEHEE